MLWNHEESGDRRNRRSDDPKQATYLQLKQVTNDFDVEQCILVDEGGKVLASDGDVSGELEELATWVPALSRQSPRKPRPAGLPSNKNLAVAEFRLNGEKRFMAVVGGKKWMRDVAVYRAILGVRRIHG